MERDFLGVRRKEAVAKGGGAEERGPCRDAAFLSPAVHWPFGNTMYSQQQFMSLKAVPDERQRSHFYEHHPSSAFQPVPATGAGDANHRSTSEFPPQKPVIINRQGSQPPQLPAYLSWAPKSFNAAPNHPNDARMLPVVSNCFIPIPSGNSYFNPYASVNGPYQAGTPVKQQQHYGGAAGPATQLTSASGALAPGTFSKPLLPKAQLTIFYEGMVNVYDNISFDKAQEIMQLAANESSKNLNSEHIRMRPPAMTPDETRIKATNVDQTPVGINMESRCLNPPSPVSVTSRTVAPSTSESSTPDNRGGENVAGSSATRNVNASTDVPDASNTLMVRAVPLMRKASLARFLEKRKERMANVSPYNSTQKSTEGSSPTDDPAKLSSKSVAKEMAHSSSGTRSWWMGAVQKTNDVKLDI